MSVLSKQSQSVIQQWTPPTMSKDFQWECTAMKTGE